MIAVFSVFPCVISSFKLFEDGQCFRWFFRLSCVISPFKLFEVLGDRFDAPVGAS